MFKARHTRFGGRGVSPGTVANSDLATMSESTIKGRASGAGAGAPQDLTAAQVRAIVTALTEVEETGAGPHADYAVAVPAHIQGTNAAGQFSGVVSSGAVIGTLLVFSHQGSGYTELLHNTTSAASNRLFNGRLGKNLRIYDNEIAVYQLLDSVAGGGSSSLRWELVSPSFPFAAASDDVSGNIIRFDGTHWLSTAGLPATSVAAIASNLAVPFVVYVSCPSGGSSGTADDVTVWNANAPFALRILDATLRVSTAVGGSSAALRTASGGGGSVVMPDPATATQTFSTAATGVVEDLAVATATVAANGSLFLRRSDRSVVGELILECVRT